MHYFDPSHMVAGKKSIIGYGASQALLATQAGCDLPLSYVVDDNPQMQGQYINSLPICSPNQLLLEDKSETFIVIFAYSSKNILNIAAHLDNMGYRYGHHYIDCSVFHYKSISRKLERVLHIAPNPETFFRTRMLSLYSGIQNLSRITGTWLFLELLTNICINVRGHIAECGVFMGGNAFISLLLLPELALKQYHLFDTFEGLPELSTHDPVSVDSDFRDVNFTAIRDMFSNFTNVRIHKGLFQSTFTEVDSLRFCMVYIDCVLYESTRDCCNFFYNRMASGGVLLFHDYWIPESRLLRKNIFTGVKRAVNEFFEDKEEDLVVFPETSHALAIKK